ERIHASPAALEVLATPALATAKPGFLDRLIHRQYQDQGAALVTFDKAAAKLSGARQLMVS
ncbi:MAG: hypothetical protein ACT4PG_13800, partial [Panacagrimonas sp.]